MMYNIWYESRGAGVNNFISKFKNNLLNKNNLEMVNIYNDMSKYQRELIDRLIEDEEFLRNYGLNDLVFDFDAKVVEKFLEIEINEYIKFCNENGISNKRNGNTKDITLTCSNRVINFNRPRARFEKNFDSILIPKRTKIIEDLHNNIILLYSKNNSVNDIKDLLNKMFGIDISTAYISNVTQQIADEVYKWRNKELDKCYFCVNIDCIYISLRDNKNISSHKIPVYVAVGTKLNGHKEILGLYLGNEDSSKNIIDGTYNKNIGESKTYWKEVFCDFKDRGVENILYLVSDGVTNLKEAVKEEFPEVFHQICVVHIVRNLKKYATKAYSKDVIKDFKKIYTASNKDLALKCWEEFKENHKDKKTIIKQATRYIEEIFPLFNLPVNIRKYIYTNNIVESVNSKLQRGFYGRGALPNKESAINILFLSIQDLEKKWSKSKVSNWDNIFKEIQFVHKDVLEKYL